MYTCRKIIGITLANIIFGIHVSLAIGSPESRVFILVALARVNASNWFQLLAFTRASATRIKTRDSGLPMV